MKKSYKVFNGEGREINSIGSLIPNELYDKKDYTPVNEVIDYTEGFATFHHNGTTIVFCGNIISVYGKKDAIKKTFGSLSRIAGKKTERRGELTLEEID